jgi:hypothetical protein
MPAPASGPPVPTPEWIVVCVGPTAITGASYAHWLTVAGKSTGGHAHARGPTLAELRGQVLGFLISSDWVKGEASRLAITVPFAKVKRTFDRLRRQEFPKPGEFRTFQRASGQTIADLLMRVELNLLSDAIQRHVVAGLRGAAAQQQALARFVAEFKPRWQAQTYCANGYEDQDCGHVQAQATL